MIRRAAVVALVVLAALAGGVGVLAVYSADRHLSVGTIALSVDPGHKGALDVYVPVVDWGARFPGVRLPVRLRVDLRTLDRAAVTRIAEGGTLDADAVRTEARDAIASYLRVLVMLVFAASLFLGALVALAVRSRMGPSLRWTLGAAAVTALATAAAVALLLPPRGHISDPEYYAHGPDIPRALAAVEDATVSSGVLNEELNDQLLGLARLVAAPAQRGAATGLPRLTLASDLHNNVLALPALERAARGAPLFFAGDVTDRGSPFETRIVKRVTRAGGPFVFVSGNHDSDTFVRTLVRQGAIVLTENGRLLRGGRLGAVVQRVAGLRVAGYSDPSARRAADDYEHGDIEPKPTVEQQDAFALWLRRLIGNVDVVMVHQEALAAVALEELRGNPPDEPIVFLVGHTHKQKLETSRNLVVMNGGSVGAGGTGNLAERGGKIGLGVLTYDTAPRFTPVAADLVEIDPASGSAKAERHRLGEAIGRSAAAR